MTWPLWAPAPHLFRLSDKKARRNFLMALTFYADESEAGGTDYTETGPSRLFVLAGFLARAEQWAALVTTGKLCWMGRY